MYLIGTVHKIVKGYIHSAENRNLAMEVGCKVLELIPAEVKKHSLEKNKALKFLFSAASKNIASSSIALEQTKLYCFK